MSLYRASQYLELIIVRTYRTQWVWLCHSAATLVNTEIQLVVQSEQITWVHIAGISSKGCRFLKYGNQADNRPSSRRHITVGKIIQVGKSLPFLPSLICVCVCVCVCVWAEMEKYGMENKEGMIVSAPSTVKFSTRS